jgi:hypothetical protein
MKNKILIFGIITMLILILIPQNLVATELETDNEQPEKHNTSEKGEWKKN